MRKDDDGQVGEGGERDVGRGWKEKGPPGEWRRLAAAPLEFANSTRSNNKDDGKRFRVLFCIRTSRDGFWANTTMVLERCMNGKYQAPPFLRLATAALRLSRDTTHLNVKRSYCGSVKQDAV